MIKFDLIGLLPTVSSCNGIGEFMIKIAQRKIVDIFNIVGKLGLLI